MGVSTDPEVDGASSSGTYQLVRVEGDGRLVPATNAEVMEVEPLVEEGKSELTSNEAERHPKGCDHASFFSKTSYLVGLSNSETARLDSRRLDAESKEERLLLPSESHDSLAMALDIDGQSSDRRNPSQACMDKRRPDNTCVQVPYSPGLNSNIKDQNGTVETFSNPATEAVPSEPSVSETCGSSLPDFSILEGEICLDDLSITELQEAFRATFGRQTSVKDRLWLKRRIAMGLTNSCEIPTTRFTIRENKIIHEEVNQGSCLMNRSETGLLAPYQVATLSNADRQDSPTNTTKRVEDHAENHHVIPGKKASKPRSAYGTKDETFENCFGGKRVRKPSRRYCEELSDVDTKDESFENCFGGKRARKPSRRYSEELSDVDTKDESFKRVRKPTRRYSEEFSDVETKDGGFENCFGKRVRRPTKRYHEEHSDVETKGESLENCFRKRVRKPTKRYIEELPDTETTERSGRSIDSLKSCGLGQSSSKSRIRAISDIDSWGTGFVARQHSFGGSSFKIPHAPRLRRRRPRKNFVAFTNFINMENAKSDIETSNSLELELDLDQQKLEDSSDNHHNNTLDTVSSFKGCPRRKHHRAWTLSEVTKLVDGVAMFGAGRWSEIKRLSFASYSYRTSVDLKDKWRNLLRASFAQSSIHQSGRNLGNNTSVPLPRSVLSRVRELAEVHSQSGIEFRPARYPSDIGRTTQEQSGFRHRKNDTGTIWFSMSDGNGFRHSIDPGEMMHS